jgi:hypothetical protein
MNRRLQIAPMSEIRESQRTAHSAGDSPSNWSQVKWEDAKFFRSSFVYDFNGESARHLNWGAVFGLAFSVGLGVSFWSAAVFLFAHFSR